MSNSDSFIFRVNNLIFVILQYLRCYILEGSYLDNIELTPSLSSFILASNYCRDNMKRLFKEPCSLELPWHLNNRKFLKKCCKYFRQKSISRCKPSLTWKEFKLHGRRRKSNVRMQGMPSGWNMRGCNLTFLCILVATMLGIWG